jgi:ubiquinone/menaquinone biosynthesis C-methylase UbiE
MTVKINPRFENEVLHLGCGRNVMPNSFNVDCVKLVGIDFVWNLNKRPWPFKSNSWNKVIAHHVLEHLDDVSASISEMHRILKPGGTVEIKVPNMAGWGAWNDPTHCNYFTRKSFRYFLKGDEWNYYFKFGFSNATIKNNFGIGRSKRLNRLMNPIVNNDLYDYWFWKIIPCAEIQVTYTK